MLKSQQRLAAFKWQGYERCLLEPLQSANIRKGETTPITLFLLGIA
jgi:hypothetical protein